MLRRLKNLTIFFGSVIIILLTINSLTETKTVEVVPENGVCDLTVVDLARDVVRIAAKEQWEFYREQLYTPQELDNGITAQPSIFQPHDEFTTQYGTFRITLNLPKGKTYGLAMSSLDYSQRAFISGVEQEPVGVVGGDQASTVPKTTWCTFYFTPVTERTELVFQYANFNHKSGGLKYPIYISEYQNTNHMNQSSLFRTCIIAGCMLTIFIFYLGMFLFFGRKKYFFYFSVCCLSIGLRTLVVGEKAIMVLLPDLNWFISIGIEYVSLILAVFSFATFIDSMFPGLLHRYVLRYLYVLSGAYVLIVLITTPIFYSMLLLSYQLSAYLAGAYIIFRLGYNLKDCKLENVMIFFGGMIFFLGALSDTLYHSRLTHYTIGGLTQITMMVCIFANMIALAVQFSRTESVLAVTMLQEQDHVKEIALLDRLNRLKTEFLSNVSHELKTPLTVVSGYAQLSGKQIEQNIRNSEVEANLRLIASEADRMALMVEQLLDVAIIEENRMELHLEVVSITEIITKTVQVYFPILNKNKNTLELASLSELPPAYADANRITQVIVNLIANAVSHTHRGKITVYAELMNAGYIKVLVKDTGSGIEPEDAEKIFDRYYTKAGDESDQSTGTGLGLFISKHIIEAHGGEIKLQSVPGEGTTVSFTLPVAGDQESSITKQ